jgi:endonuclease-8
VPEGDTIHKIAGYLAPRIENEVIERAEARDSALACRCEGRTVTGVTARGKHLFIELDDGNALRSHLGMYGSWHRYPPGAEWRKPRRQASLVLAIAGDDYVCFNAKEVELIRLPSVRERVVHGRLGPDLIADEVSATALVRRARDILEPDVILADVLLDQRVACGVGNVYKSEIAFIERLHPAAPLGGVPDERLAGCFDTAAALLRRNLGGGKRVTRFENDGAGRLWVYGRDGLPCLACEGRIRTARLGRHQRSTYWCPRCQPAEDSGGLC